MSPSARSSRVHPAVTTVGKLAALMLPIALLACAPANQAPSSSSSPAETASPAPTALTDEQLDAEFRAAVVDASVAEPDEISDQLTAIDPENDDVVWNKKRDHVLMTTWTSWDGYDDQIGKKVVLQREAWVTAAPEFKRFCASYQPDEATPLTLRLEQLLGLPPHNGKTRVVEMWMPADQLFRPSPDPEIDDHTADLEMPPAKDFKSKADYEAHKDWFNLQRSLSYDEKNGYPWTRLGYTYDWGNPESEVGLSEFVTWAKTPVRIKRVATTEDYCGS